MPDTQKSGRARGTSCELRFVVQVLERHSLMKTHSLPDISPIERMRDDNACARPDIQRMAVPIASRRRLRSGVPTNNPDQHGSFCKNKKR